MKAHNIPKDLIEKAMAVSRADLAAGKADEAEATISACNVLHGAFILRDQGEDTPELREERLALFERYGHEIMHLAADGVVANEEGGGGGTEDNAAVLSAVGTIVELAVTVERTLASPIEAEAKLAHLQETILEPKRLAYVHQAHQKLQRMGLDPFAKPKTH